MEKTHLKHDFEPVYDKSSEILILGSFPSVRSREEHFYYANKQNRFWRLIADIYETKTPDSVEEKKTLILNNRLALWDVISECDIYGSSDSSIENVTVSDLKLILDCADIKKIIANGATAGKLLKKYFPSENIPHISVLPSTSPANASWSYEKLKAAWRLAVRG